MNGTTNIYGPATLAAIQKFPFVQKLGGIWLGRDGKVIVVKPVDQDFEIGRGATVEQALQSALDWIMAAKKD